MWHFSYQSGITGMTTKIMFLQDNRAAHGNGFDFGDKHKSWCLILQQVVKLKINEVPFLFFTCFHIIALYVLIFALWSLSYTNISLMQNCSWGIIIWCDPRQNISPPHMRESMALHVASLTWGCFCLLCVLFASLACVKTGLTYSLRTGPCGTHAMSSYKVGFPGKPFLALASLHLTWCGQFRFYCMG